VIVCGLIFNSIFAARQRRHSLVRWVGAGAVVAATVRLFAHAQRVATRSETDETTSSTLVSIVAHEIRAPLAAIRGSIALLAEHLETLDPQRRAELLRVALDASKQLGALVDDLLLVSRIAGGRLVFEDGPVDLVAIVRDAANAEITQPVSVVEQVGVPFVRGDALRVRQVVTNLLSNAVANARESSVVLASISSDDQTVRVTIYNEGRGIPPEEQSRLFLPFASLGERRVDSTGLGLFIAKELVEAMGGTIGFDTQPGRNAAFWFTLQTAAPASLEHPEPR
jgi:signal transduction histidine kinase